ncbi:putative phosphotransferase involved in extracellular matrix synthesis [Carnobacterium sp. 17-4]|uniref:sugar transferase n=1 Tax=Carnobacterium sp. (strain 17-4) TaxID=208596 RepID=UPI0002058AFC|nr:sugar transferase [Carnobacterium sp. 17-4]AEB30097.1 putative phosphotransferase involved in extracellular matrix synthesis [Carnobacterium sp. 17-4]
MTIYYPIKSMIEWIFAAMLFLIVLPVILIVGILIKIEDPTGPIFFIQERVGKDNKLFNMYKLRSMRNPTIINEKEMSYDDRMLKVGQVIRKLSLDELPQMINILKGEMSFIGPRPLLVEYLPCYNKKELRRHNVKPGISGWAQVNGRNHLSWEDRFALDVEYVEKCSFSFDIKIIFMTIQKVLMKADIVEKEGDYIVAFDEYRKRQWEYEKGKNNVTSLFTKVGSFDSVPIVQNSKSEMQ